MNKREFVAGGVVAVVAAPALADPLAGAPRAGLRARTRRLPDLAERSSAATWAAYVGERFTAAGGGVWTLTGVEFVGRCARTEQFDVTFAGPAADDGVHVLVHGTGQRVALHLEPGARGSVARFNLLV